LLFRRSSTINDICHTESASFHRQKGGRSVALCCQAAIPNGATRAETVENVKTAIREWLHVEAEETGVARVEEDAVAI